MKNSFELVEIFNLHLVALQCQPIFRGKALSGLEIYQIYLVLKCIKPLNKILSDQQGIYGMGMKIRAELEETRRQFVE